MTRRDWMVLGGVAVAVLVGVQCFPASQPMAGLGGATTRQARWEPWQRAAFREVATCLGRDPAFPRGLKLSYVDGFTWWNGMYTRSPHVIYLRRDRRADTALLKHEFVHYLEWPVTHGPLYREAERCGFTPHTP